MSVAIDSDFQCGYLKVDIVGTADVAACLGSLANPEGVALQVVEGWLWIEEGAHAAATQNIGFGASGADENDLLSAFAVNQADNTMWTVVARAAAEAAATTQSGCFWPATEYLTVTNAAQASTGLKAHLYLKYIRLA